ncbi:copper amine oxidase N-terminal domain-containing protein [Cellulosilyticum sp. I15G10I2]|uniref:copper amine oxidase N-terminal domain-containing protein n=1 Tax=Cellulosilyticum sp. I15G10I2 TaxID=1892843 RepID=UPI00085C3B65|nr:copper amine oxidase N-terminal domain-containing protein [Cellulosilyticum sp. I15G10I2]
MTMQKSIIYLLVSAIIFTMFPTISYSASDNRITKVVTVGVDEVIEAQGAPRLVIDLKDELEPEDTFYLILEGAEWAVGTGINEIIGEIQGMPFSESMPRLETLKINHKELQIRVKDAMIFAGVSLRIPLHTQIKEAVATVRINNNNTAVSANTHSFAKSMDYRGKVTSDKVSTATRDSVMADLVIEEPYSQAFHKAMLNHKRNTIQMVLNSNDYEFVLDMPSLGVPKLQGIKGFDTITGGSQNLRKIDAQTLELTLPDLSSVQSTGGFVLSGVGLKTTNQTPAQGMVTVNLQGDLIFNTTVNVLKVVDYGIDLIAAKMEETVAGKSKNVTFTLEEKVHQSLIRERLTTFTFTKGARVRLGQDNRVEVTLNGTKMLYYPIMQNGKAVGFEVPQLSGTTMKYQFELPLDLPSSTEGEIEVIADGRSLINTLSASILEVKPAARVTMSPMHLRLGLKDQRGGKITITETAKGEIRQDTHLFIKIEDSQVIFTHPPLVQVIAGDIRLGSAKIVPGGIEIPVTRRSNSASIIEIKDFLVTVNQMVAEGTYTAEVGGPALSDFTSSSDIDPVMQGAFMIISKDGAPVVKEQVTFKIGEAAYTVGGQKKAMDAPPYIKNGRTMLPIKYVAYALGIDPGNVMWNGTTRTVTVVGDQVIALKIGSSIMHIDGVAKQMSAPPEIYHDRTFVPVAEITRALGVETKWDEVLRMVIFN